MGILPHLDCQYPEIEKIKRDRERERESGRENERENEREKGLWR